MISVMLEGREYGPVSNMSLPHRNAASGWSCAPSAWSAPAPRSAWLISSTISPAWPGLRGKPRPHDARPRCGGRGRPQLADQQASRDQKPRAQTPQSAPRMLKDRVIRGVLLPEMPATEKRQRQGTAHEQIAQAVAAVRAICNPYRAAEASRPASPANAADPPARALTEGCREPSSFDRNGVAATLTNVARSRTTDRHQAWRHPCRSCG